jgi:hypothetical protein
MRESSLTRDSFQSEENDAVAMAPSNCHPNDIEQFYIEYYSAQNGSHEVQLHLGIGGVWSTAAALQSGLTVIGAVFSQTIRRGHWESTRSHPLPIYTAVPIRAIQAPLLIEHNIGLWAVSIATPHLESSLSQLPTRVSNS